ncbi:MAG: hypothetical protein OHK0022_13670 [Roseiflexaceae bacterium]
MRPDEQIARIAEIGNHPAVSKTFVQAVVRYLNGEIALADVLEEQNRSTRGYLPLNDIATAMEGGDQLTEVDLRMLELNHALRQLHTALNALGKRRLLFQARDQLVARGMREQHVVGACLTNSFYLFDQDGTLLPCGLLMLSYLPDRLDLLLQSVALLHDTGLQLNVAHLLLHTEAPPLNQIWELINTSSHFYGIGGMFKRLLELDGERASAWARETLASTAAAALSFPDVKTLLTLLVQTGQPANLAAVAGIARLGHPNPHEARAYDAAEALLAHAPPEAYAGLALELSESQQPAIQLSAVQMLGRQPIEQVLPALQRCVAASNPVVAMAAISGLQAQPWAGNEAYMAGLLAHQSKEVREAAAAWLAQRGDAVTGQIAPLLAHRSADVRLSAAVLLGRIASEQARALLAVRLDVEKSEKVRRAIIDAAGAATAAAPEAQADPRAAFLSEAEAAMRRIKQPVLPWLDPASTGLRWSDGTALPGTAVAYILYRQSRHKQPQPDPQIAPVLAQLDPESAAAFAEALWQRWQAEGQQAKESWCLILAGALCGDRLVGPLHTKIEEWAKAGRGALAAQAVYALAVIGSDLALTSLDGIATRIKHNQVRTAARKALHDAAGRAGLSPEDLADQITPRLGFDTRGEQTLDYGPRRFTVRLAGGLGLLLTDAAGKRLSTPPKPAKSDDPALAEAAQARWKQLKAQLKQATTLLTMRLERALISQRAWPIERWQALFLQHPLLRALATRLIWLAEPSSNDSNSKLNTQNSKLIFRPLEDGSLTDAGDEPVALPASGRVRLTHPLALDEAEQAAWRQHLADYAVVQPFPQIDRPVVRVQPEERDARLWTRYGGYLMNGGALKGRYLKAGWERGPIGDNGSYYLLFKPFPEASLLAVLETAGLTVNYEQEFNTALLALAFLPIEPGDTWHPPYQLRPDEERALSLGDVPPVIFSEAAADLVRFAEAGAYDAEWKQKIW